MAATNSQHSRHTQHFQQNIQDLIGRLGDGNERVNVEQLEKLKCDPEVIQLFAQNSRLMFELADDVRLYNSSSQLMDTLGHLNQCKDLKAKTCCLLEQIVCPNGDINKDIMKCTGNESATNLVLKEVKNMAEKDPNAASEKIFSHMQVSCGRRLAMEMRRDGVCVLLWVVYTCHEISTTSAVLGEASSKLPQFAGRIKQVADKVTDLQKSTRSACEDFILRGEFGQLHFLYVSFIQTMNTLVTLVQDIRNEISQVEGRARLHNNSRNQSLVSGGLEMMISAVRAWSSGYETLHWGWRIFNWLVPLGYGVAGGVHHMKLQDCSQVLESLNDQLDRVNNSALLWNDAYTQFNGMCRKMAENDLVTMVQGFRTSAPTFVEQTESRLRQRQLINRRELAA